MLTAQNCDQQITTVTKVWNTKLSKTRCQNRKIAETEQFWDDI